MRAAVVVVGDLGRSPRMQYHARALAISGVDVDLVGYKGAPLPRFLTDEARIAIHRLDEPRWRYRASRSSKVIYGLLAALDGFRASLRLMVALMRMARPDLLLVQNPPALPTLHVAWLVSRLRRVRLVIDWHNLGFSILALRLGRRHLAVRLARWFEQAVGRSADGHLCVSRGFARFLSERFRIADVTVLYDRPASSFAPVERPEREHIRQSIFSRLEIRGGTLGFIVCPTSWTADEDFDVVIDAVAYLEDRIRGWEGGGPARRFSDLVILVTGDGTRRSEFERRFAGLPARRVQLRTRWLDPEDYPRIVGSADLGLCLHRSSSGVDIPMKVADLFGAGVPVLALDYGACLAERVRHGFNGLLFSNARQLGDLLFDLFEDFPSSAASLDRLRAGARRSAQPTWEAGWTIEARPVLMPAESPAQRS